MPPIFLIPLAYAGLRTVISAAVGYKVDRGIEETAAAAVCQISRSLLVNVAEIVINILVFLLIVYKAGTFFDYQTSVLMICSVYVGSLLHSSCKTIRNFNLRRNSVWKSFLDRMKTMPKNKESCPEDQALTSSQRGRVGLQITHGIME